MTVQNHLFRAHALFMSYITNTFLLVRSSVRSKELLCFAHGQGQKSEQKPTTKNFVRFHNHSPLLTMFYINNSLHLTRKYARIFVLGHCLRETANGKDYL